MKQLNSPINDQQSFSIRYYYQGISSITTRLSRILRVTAGVLLCSLPIKGNQLDLYISQGLENNLSVRQERTQKYSAETSLKEATSRFLPTLTLSSRYTRADGGRTVSIPAGEIMVQSMRDLGMPVAPNIPAPDPMTITIMPEQEQETKLQLTQPLFAPALIANYRLNKQLVNAASFTLERTALVLIRDIRLAYYNCLQAKEGITVYSAARDRALQQRTTAEKLHRAGMQTATTVTSAKANCAAQETAVLRSRADFDNACKALNVLLNRPVESELALDPPDSAQLSEALDAKAATFDALDSAVGLNRPELKQLSAAKAASEALKAVEKSGFAPTLIGALEGGIIGDRYKVSDETTFYTASLLLQWNLFSGLGKVHKVKKAQAAIEKIEQQIIQTRDNIRLQIEKTVSDVTIARKTYLDSELQHTAAKENYRSVFKRFEQGSATSMEMTEAGELLTKAEANRSFARYSLFKHLADLRYATAADTDLIAAHSVEKRSTP